MIASIVFVTVILSIVSGENINFELIKTDKLGAKCLDGSVPGFYFQDQGNKDKLMIIFEGGGKCFGNTKEEMLKSCYERSFGNMGTSKNWRQTIKKKNILSSDQIDNPNFYDYNKIFIPYCDGTYHVGYSEEAHKYEDKELFFRGQNNTDAVLDSVFNDLEFGKAKQVFLTGASAGAVATVMWMNEIKGKLSENCDYRVAPDGGYLISLYGDEQEKQFYQTATELVYNQASLVKPQECPYKDDDELRYKCWMHEELFKVVDKSVPLLIINSLYDPWSVANTLEFECVKDWQGLTLNKCSPSEIIEVHKFGEKIKKQVKELMQDNQNLSCWLISCVKHVFVEDYPFKDENYTIPQNSPNTIDHVLKQWINTQKSISYVDQDRWPLNRNCANLFLDRTE